MIERIKKIKYQKIVSFHKVFNYFLNTKNGIYATIKGIKNSILKKAIRSAILNTLKIKNSVTATKYDATSIILQVKELILIATITDKQTNSKILDSCLL